MRVPRQADPATLRHLRSLLSMLVPPLCAVCASPCDPAEDACSRCIADIRAAPGGPLLIPNVDAAWAATAYEDTSRRLIAQLKFGARLRLARVAACAVAERSPAPPPGAGVVPVPADPIRHRMRGFDPAQLIARELATHMTLPLCQCLCRHHGRRQVGRSRTERLAGPRVHAIAPAPATIVLVDDVVTTGTTLAACARAAREAGASEVLALAFARA